MKTPRDFGHIRKLPSGRYQASYLDEGRERVYAPMTFPKEKQAKEWLTGIENDRIQGITRKAVKKTKTLAEYAETWLAHHPKLRPTSRDQHRRNLDRFILPRLGKLKLTDLDLPLVRKWHAEIGQELAKSPRVLASGNTGKNAQAAAYRLLRAIMTTAVEDGEIEVNPCRLKNVSHAEKERPDEQILTPHQIAELANLINPRYKAMVLLAAYGTLRHGELIGLRRRDIDLVAGTVTVNNNKTWAAGEWHDGNPKDGRRGRPIVLPSLVVEALRRHLDKYVGDSPASPVFTTRNGTPPSRSTVRAAMMAAGAKFGRPDLFPHLLRHTALTLFGMTGATAKEIMDRGGHSSLDVAQVYQHSMIERERELTAKLDEMARKAA